MNKEMFESLNLLEQIDFVNNELKQGKSLTSIATEIGIGRSTIGRRAEKANYIFKKELNQYIIKTKNSNKELQMKDNSNNEVVQNVTDNYQSNNKVIEVSKLVAPTLSDNNDDNNYKDIMKVIGKMADKLDEVYSWYNKEKNCVEVIELKINKFNGDAVNRTYKLYPEVQEHFKDFCEKNKTYKVQDIISQALVEFMDKYK